MTETEVELELELELELLLLLLFLPLVLTSVFTGVDESVETYVFPLIVTTEVVFAETLTDVDGVAGVGGVGGVGVAFCALAI